MRIDKYFFCLFLFSFLSHLFSRIFVLFSEIEIKVGAEFIIIFTLFCANWTNSDIYTINVCKCTITNKENINLIRLKLWGYVIHSFVFFFLFTVCGRRSRTFSSVFFAFFNFFIFSLIFLIQFVFRFLFVLLKFDRWTGILICRAEAIATAVAVVVYLVCKSHCRITNW